MKVLYILITLIMLNTFGCASSAKTLNPPVKIPFADDVRIDRYATNDALKHFTYSGDWKVVAEGAVNSIVGISRNDPALLISNDKLSSKPKKLKLDFNVTANDYNFAFYYGNMGVVVKGNTMYAAEFDDKGNIVSIDNDNTSTFSYKINEMNTLLISTGHRPSWMGGGMGCSIHINSNGVYLKHQDIERPFGVYIAPHTSIKINNIRWYRGGK